MKFVYVLVRDNKDYYLEETLISIFSLRKNNPDAHITLVVDNLTDFTFTEEKVNIRNLVDEYIVEEIPNDLNQTQKSRYLKTSIRKIVKGDFLYIDNDTLILDEINESDFLNCDVGAVLNQHRMDWSEKNPHPMVGPYTRKTGISLIEDIKITNYFNGGVFFAKDNRAAHDFFKKWHDLWLVSSTKYGFHKDQPDMWRANALSGNIISAIDGKYNVQAIYPNYSLEYLPDCRIFHYFSSSPYASHLKFKQKDYLKKLREYGITDEVKEYLSNIKREYLKGLYITMDEAIKWVNSPGACFGRKVARRFPVIDYILPKLFGKKLL